MPAKTQLPAPDSCIDLAPFAQPSAWTDGEGSQLKTTILSPDENGLYHPLPTTQADCWQVGLEWQETQEIISAGLVFSQPIPADTSIYIQYWRKNFPTIAPERLPGARRGWIGCDDPFHGEWVTVHGEGKMEGERYHFQFDPLDLAELPKEPQKLEEAEDYLPLFRRTLKLRALICTHEHPGVRSFQAYSWRHWRKQEFHVLFGVNGEKAGDWSGMAEPYLGYLIDLQPLYFDNSDKLIGENIWQCQVKDRPKGLKMTVLGINGSADDQLSTLVTIRTQIHSFTFRLNDLKRGPVHIPGYDILIYTSNENASPKEILQQTQTGIRSIYDRVADQPEQTLQRAMGETPRLDVVKQAPYGRYLPLGLEDGRQEFALRYNGELFIDKRALKLAGRDAARLLYPGHVYRFRFGSGDPPNFRENEQATTQSLEEGWLPIIYSTWQDREISYTQTTLVAPISGQFPAPNQARGDEETAAHLRFTIRNTTSGKKTCSLWIATSPQEQLILKEDAVYGIGRVVPATPVQRQFTIAQYKEPRFRFRINHNQRGDLSLTALDETAPFSHTAANTLLYQVTLQGFETHDLYLTIPFATPTNPEQIPADTSDSFQTLLANTATYWKQIIETGMQVVLPDMILADFHKAAQVHIAISSDKDPVSGLTVLPPGTWAYRACGNEACWQITMLDQAGQHERAEQLLEIFLRTQGVYGLDGNFTTTHGALQGLDMDDGEPMRTHFAYNLDHGVIMECLADHYLYSGDLGWLERVAPNLIAACDFIIRERAATRICQPDGRPNPAWGLMPAGHLEDNPEWRHWFAVNAHAYHGMYKIGSILREVNQNEAERILAEAEAYREDIRKAALRAMIEAPVVQKLDGKYIPQIPSRTHLRGRELGWFRQAAYGAIHLLEANIFAPNDPEMTWVIQDLEDNLYPSRAWGRPVDLERDWFSQAGITIQPNLTDMAIDYLRRGEIKHGLRALFNNFATSLYPDVRVFTEHPVIELGHGVGPFYKSSDEAKALIWLRSFLLYENSDEIWITPAAPRHWFRPGQQIALKNAASHFGTISFQIDSNSGSIQAEITLPARKIPSIIKMTLRTPECQPIVSISLNGKNWTRFDPQSGEIQIPYSPQKINLTAAY